MSSCRIENLTQVTFPMKSGPSWLRIWHWCARTPLNVSTTCSEVFNGLRWVVRTGSPWRYMPHDLPPWEASLPADP